MAFVGRLVAVKNPERFLRAAALVGGARFLVVGDGPLRAQLEALAAQLAPRRHVHRRASPTRAPLIAGADVLVVSSDSEGQSIATLEALAAGTPVVSTPVSGMTGLLGGGAGVSWLRLRARDPGDGDRRARAGSRPADAYGSHRRKARARALFGRCDGRRLRAAIPRPHAYHDLTADAAQRAPRDPQEAPLRRARRGHADRRLRGGARAGHAAALRVDRHAGADAEARPEARASSASGRRTSARC